MSKDTVRSALCDEWLLRSGTWDSKSAAAISDWIRSEDFDERRIKGAILIQFLVEQILGDHITDEGKFRARRLAENLIHLEDLLITTRSGIGKKFYRDHLNHMLRVAILANAIASKQRTLAESKSQIAQLSLACLFHDMAYPLAESRMIMGDIMDTMRRCYKTIVFPQLNYAYSMSRERVTKLAARLSSPSHQIGDLDTKLEEFSHSVVGGIEFLDYVKDAEPFQGALEAIVFHDSSFDSEVSFDKSPLLAILIIADEMQDWGRPVPFEKGAVIPEIGQLDISETRVNGELDYQRESSLSAFRQARSKLRNLRRLNLTSCKLSVNMCMVLPPYERTDLGGMETCIAKLCDPEHLDQLELSPETAQEIFMERYYGTKVSQATHSLILKSMQDGTLTQISPIGQFYAYLNPARAELVLADKSIGCPKAISLTNKNGGPFNLVIKGNQEQVGELYGENDTEWRPVAEFLAEELRIFNRLCGVAKTKGDSLVPLPLDDFFLSPGQMRERLTRAKLEIGQPSFVDQLRHVRKAMSEDGLFIIRKRITT